MSHEKPDHPEIPKVIGQRYEILGQLREEPWGEVWLAQDKVLNARVGLKIFWKDAEAGADVQRVFEQEAVLGLRLRHPQILGVFHLGETERLLYLVEEPFEGEALADQMARHQRFGLLKALHILEQACQALALAHQQGLVHQSFSPLHVLLKGEEVRVANFAFPARDEDQAIHLELKAYHPPEAINGEGVTPQGNVFSLGVLGFRLVAGSLPYPITFDEPFPYRLETPPVDLDEIPIPLQNALLRCLAVEPEERFPDSGAFLAQLRQIREPWRKDAPARTATWELERSRATWRKGTPAAEVAAKVWATAKTGARKMTELVKAQGGKLKETGGKLKEAKGKLKETPEASDNIKGAPRRLWWGLGFAVLIIILAVVGSRLRSPAPSVPDSSTKAPALPSAEPQRMKAPSAGGGPPLVETEGAPGTEAPPPGEPAAVKAPPAPPAAAAEAKPAREERYLILAATYAREDQAQTLSRRLRANKFKAQVVKKKVGGKTRYQVQLGPVTGTKQAEDLARRLKTQEKLSPKIEKLKTRSANPSGRRATG